MLLEAAALLWSLHDGTLWKDGTGLLASAGLASPVPALAAKSTASSFFAGLQIALSEPIRIDDVVVTQDEWGRAALPELDALDGRHHGNGLPVFG